MARDPAANVLIHQLEPSNQPPAEVTVALGSGSSPAGHPQSRPLP